MPKISFRNVKKVYPNGTYALDGISFDIEQGDFVCVIGESGGGKTTLLKLISGLDKATSGEIYFDGEISNYMKVAQRNVAFVFQEYTIYPNMTVFENIILSLKSHKISYEEKCELAWDIIKKMELEIIQGELPKALSFGQCQKVALAKALVRKPQIILFDEPLSNIDVAAKKEYKKLILEAKKILPECTFIYVTHNINDAMQLSNKIMVIDNGHIIQFGEKQQVFQFPNSKLVADYILEGREELKGTIQDGYFICESKKIELSEFQKVILQNKSIDDVCCYSLGNINVFFDEEGNSVAGFKQCYITKMEITDEEFILFDKTYKLGGLKEAILEKGNMRAIFKQEFFAFEKNDGMFEMKGQVIYKLSDFIVVKINNLVVPFINHYGYNVNDNISVFYPLDELKANNENNEQVIASYIISDNLINAKVVNAKKGIIKIKNVKIMDSKFIGKSGIISIKVPLDAFIFNAKGKFVCDTLYNEENLGSRTLVHFSCGKINDYMSAIAEKDFQGYNKNKVKFDIDFLKIQILEKE